MPHTIYDIARGKGPIWRFEDKGQAINFCAKYNIDFGNIIERIIKSVDEVEKETGINYGCQPCGRLIHKECNGAKPGAFYYPTECPMFDPGEEFNREKEEAGW